MIDPAASGFVGIPAYEVCLRHSKDKISIPNIRSYTSACPRPITERRATSGDVHIMLPQLWPLSPQSFGKYASLCPLERRDPSLSVPFYMSIPAILLPSQAESYCAAKLIVKPSSLLLS